MVNPSLQYVVVAHKIGIRYHIMWNYLKNSQNNGSVFFSRYDQNVSQGIREHQTLRLWANHALLRCGTVYWHSSTSITILGIFIVFSKQLFLLCCPLNVKMSQKYLIMLDNASDYVLNPFINSKFRKPQYFNKMFSFKKSQYYDRGTR